MLSFLTIAFFLLLFSHLALRDRVEELEKNKQANDKNEAKRLDEVVPFEPPETSPRLTPNFPTETTNSITTLAEEKEKFSFNEFRIIRWFGDQTLIKIGGIFFFLGMGWFVSYIIKVELAPLLDSSPSLVIFSASTLIALVGYVLFKKGFSTHVVGLYVTFAALSILIGTSFLLSGSMLTLALIYELVAAFLLVTYLSLPARVIWITAGLFIFPLLSSLSSFRSSAWGSGLWHGDGLVIYSLLLVLCLCTFWLIYKPGVAVFSSGKKLVGYFGFLSFVYAYAVVATVTGSFFTGDDSFVMMYVLWAIISIGVIYYAQRQMLAQSIINYATLSLILPVLVSFESFTAPAWENGIYHHQSFGLLAIILIGFLVILLLTQQLCRDFDISLRKIVGWLVVFEIAYIFVTVSVFAHSLFSSHNALVVTYVIYAVILYLVISLFMKLHVRLFWLKTALLTLMLPILFSLDSFALSGSNREYFLVDLIGLLSLVAIFFLLSYGLRTQTLYANEKSGLPVLSFFSQGLTFLLAGYLIGATWSLTQTFSANAEIVSLTLFIYTFAGLALYLYSKQTSKIEFRYIGISLLGFVVGRLVLVDIWQMDLVWRFVSLLVIGAMFIGASFVERKKFNNKIVEVRND